MSNLSHFELNCIHAFQGAAMNDLAADEAAQIFLRWKEKGRLQAERVALEWCAMGPLLDRMLTLAAIDRKRKDALPSLRRFIRERHERRYYPNN